MKEILQDHSLEEIEALVSELGEPKYRAGQLFRGLMRGGRISDISELSKAFKAKLLERFEDEPVRIAQVFTASDGTEKYLFELADGNIIEGVLMRYKYGNTQCVSTQVGCRMDCAFCASGLNGLIRNLTAGEILSQVLVVNARLGGTPNKRAVTNVVLMGSGEPLDNYANTVRFLRNVTAPGGICISARNISLSTCGLVPRMYDLAEEGIPVNLTVSLHAPSDEERARIMPEPIKLPISSPPATRILPRPAAATSLSIPSSRGKTTAKCMPNSSSRCCAAGPVTSTSSA